MADRETIININTSGISMPGAGPPAPAPAVAEALESRVARSQEPPPAEVKESEIPASEEEHRRNLLGHINAWQKSQYASQQIGKHYSDKELLKMTNEQLEDIIEKFKLDCCGWNSGLMSVVTLQVGSELVEGVAPFIGKNLKGFKQVVMGNQAFHALHEQMILTYFPPMKVPIWASYMASIYEMVNAVDAKNRGQAAPLLAGQIAAQSKTS